MAPRDFDVNCLWHWGADFNKKAVRVADVANDSPSTGRFGACPMVSTRRSAIVRRLQAVRGTPAVKACERAQ